ncbi:MAG: aminopeptidase P family protein [Meiothermus sp.]
MIRQKLPQVQQFLREHNIDGWLVYDFRGTNPFATKVLNHGGNLLTRRWFVWIPAQGEPKILVHDIEFGSFPRVGYEVSKYNGRETLPAELLKLMGGAKTVAMEYSPNGNIPYVSKVDGGTVDLMRSLGVNVVSSGDLLQLFLAWTPEQLANHRKAAEVLTATKDAALAHIRQHVSSNIPLTEYQLQQYMNQFILDRGLDPDHPPIIGFGPGGGDPHYVPSATRSKALERGDAILMDLWCKVPGDNPFADITWMAFYGTPTDKFTHAYTTVVASRDAGVDLLQSRLSLGQRVKGYEVDLTVRKVLIDGGYEANLKHRTGHSLGITAVHGEVAHFDGFETWDERLVLPNLGFTIEPGVYFPEFGVRSEINVYSHPDRIEVTTAVQTELDVID